MSDDVWDLYALIDVQMLIVMYMLIIIYIMFYHDVSCTCTMLWCILQLLLNLLPCQSLLLQMRHFGTPLIQETFDVHDWFLLILSLPKTTRRDTFRMVKHCIDFWSYPKQYVLVGVKLLAEMQIFTMSYGCRCAMISNPQALICMLHPNASILNLTQWL